MTGVIGVARARDDENVWPHRPHVLDDIVDNAHRVDGDDDTRGRRQTAAFEESRIGRIAVIHVMALAAVAGDGQGVGVGGDVGDTVLPQERAHDFADPAVTDDDRVLLSAGRPRRQFRIVGLGRRKLCREMPRANGKKRRQRHGHRSDGKREARQRYLDQARCRRHADADESEFTSGTQQQAGLGSDRPG
jgi:hypothetical protein